MDFYLQLLQEQYCFLESQYEQRMNAAPADDEKQTCPCGLAWIDECNGCEEGETYRLEGLEIAVNN
jgi:hypothetical protein